MTESDTYNEFPAGAMEPPDAVTRRELLAVMGASTALAIGGCARPPREQILPYVRQPEGIVAGTSRFYATAMTLGGYATGLLVECRDGRPIKIEGNELHPASLGATDAFAQAAILSLYDPDRSRAVLHDERIRSWPDAVAALRAQPAVQQKTGAGIRVLTEAVSSPTFARQMERLLAEFPGAKWVQYEPVHRDAIHAALGAEPVYDLKKANVILALDADFLASGPGHLRYARAFASRRRVWEKPPAEASMNRLYTVGPTPTPTSASADHRLALKAADVGAFAQAVAARLGIAGVAAGEGRFPEDWLAGLVADLRNSEGASLVIAGDTQPADVHALAHAINNRLKNVGKTVNYIPQVPVRLAGDRGLSLTQLADEMRQGRVELLLILGANPVYSAPADVEFAKHLVNVPFRLHLGVYRDETARLCQWHVPETHFLEEWGDARAFDGTASLVQPLIEPLFGGISALQLLASLRGEVRSPYELVRDFWREQWKNEFDSRWNKALRDGVIEGSAFEPKKVEPKGTGGLRSPLAGLEIVFRPDPTLFDGRFATNGWLQELPKPLTKLTWDTVAVVGPATARELGLMKAIGAHGGDMSVDLVELHYRGRVVEAPAWIQPGQVEGSVTVYLGGGRSAVGVGFGVGFNAYAIRTSEQPWIDGGLELRKTGRQYRLATTQLHHTMHGRDIIRSGTLNEYQTQSASNNRRALPLLDAVDPPSFYEPKAYTGHKWGMVIDLTSCTGCGACVVACQAENNIPVVGKEEVARGREMHWLRIDTYYTGSDEQPDHTYFQPVPCMHCEKAPCEYVCPVNATVHSDDGLNDMVYNRCVGTRYCSNNCPYKVRRFNFFQYANWEDESVKAMRNPEVTVRSRGVMEKCTYCVQRIRAAEIHAELDGRAPVRNRAGEMVTPIHAHELRTACQAACPSEAIAFGDLNDANSRVAKMRDHQTLNYGLLAEELGTRPRTTYLAALKNTNPAITTE